MTRMHRMIVATQNAKENYARAAVHIVGAINYTCKWYYFRLFALSLPQNLIELTSEQINVRRAANRRRRRRRRRTNVAHSPALTLSQRWRVRENIQTIIRRRIIRRRVVNRDNDLLSESTTGELNGHRVASRRYVDHSARSFLSRALEYRSSFVALYLLLIRLSIVKTSMVYGLINDWYTTTAMADERWCISRSLRSYIVAR